MTCRLIVQPTAEQDIVAALDWYDDHAPEQGGRLLDELAAMMVRIRESPNLFRAVHGQVRRAALGVFPSSSGSCSTMTSTSCRSSR